jgi:hypothetical protein
MRRFAPLTFLERDIYPLLSTISVDKTGCRKRKPRRDATLIGVIKI